jgi:hypothetical protein
MKRLHVSERRACKVLGQNRSAQRYVAKERDEEGPLTAAIIELASQYGRYGYRRITFFRDITVGALTTNVSNGSGVGRG